MRKALLAALCVMGLCIWGATTASAGVITWKILESPTQAGHGPGPDLKLGTADDSLITQPPGTADPEQNKCDLVSGTQCAKNGVPTTGSFSFLKIETFYSGGCMYLDLADPNNGKPCTTIGECPGSPLGCQLCETVHSYMGYTSSLGNGLFTTCQEDPTDPKAFTYTGMTIGLSETVPGFSSGTLNLDTGTNGGTTPCGAGVMSSTLNLKFYLVDGLIGPAGHVPNVVLNGYVYSATAAAPVGICTYTAAEIDAIRATLPAGATYMMVVCEPGLTLADWPSTTAACLPKATVSSILVAYTTNAVGDCSSTCTPKSCAGGTAEDVE